MYCGKTDVSAACGDGRSALAETKVRPVAAIHYRNRSDPDIRLGSLWEGWQWRAADRDCESRCGHSSRRASGHGAAFGAWIARALRKAGAQDRSPLLVAALVSGFNRRCLAVAGGGQLVHELHSLIGCHGWRCTRRRQSLYGQISVCVRGRRRLGPSIYRAKQQHSRRNERRYLLTDTTDAHAKASPRRRPRPEGR
jgi:hypothetical protein